MSIEKGCYKKRSKSSRDDWATPDPFFELLNEEFRFTLDPASDELNHKTLKYYTKKEDGLSKDWAGESVFVNPPFNQKDIWIEKCYNEGQKSNTTIVLIIPSTTDTIPWHDYVMKADEIRFCKGRVNFMYPKKIIQNIEYWQDLGIYHKLEDEQDYIEEEISGATFPLAIIIFRNPKKYDLKVSSFTHKKD